MLNTNRGLISLALLLSTSIVLGQTSTTAPIAQKSDRSPCSNIVASGSVTCNSQTSQRRTKTYVLNDLRERTNALADEILDYTFAREGQINAWMQQARAQMILDAIHGNKNGTEEFQARKMAWDRETNAKFVELYWPRVASLETELAIHGVDISPVVRAIALNGHRKTGLMLSVVASRIGHTPPFSRVITSSEARVFVQANGLPEVELYALMSDPNSKSTAETLRKEFKRQGIKVSKSILPLDPSEGKPGIHLIYPSADWTTVENNLIPTLEQAELETTWEVKSMKQPPSILKIEIRPESPNWSSRANPPSLIHFYRNKALQP